MLIRCYKCLRQIHECFDKNKTVSVAKKIIGMVEFPWKRNTNENRAGNENKHKI